MHATGCPPLAQLHNPQASHLGAVTRTEQQDHSFKKKKKNFLAVCEIWAKQLQQQQLRLHEPKETNAGFGQSSYTNKICQMTVH